MTRPAPLGRTANNYKETVGQSSYKADALGQHLASDSQLHCFIENITMAQSGLFFRFVAHFQF